MAFSLFKNNKVVDELNQELARAKQTIQNLEQKCEDNQRVIAAAEAARQKDQEAQP